MPIYDVSLPISMVLPTYPGDPPILVERVQRMEDGAVCNVSRVSLGSHTGTHIDPPRHFIADGRAVDELPLGILIGRTHVAEISGEGPITVEKLASLHLSRRVRRLLLKTRNSARWAAGVKEFFTDYAALTPDAANWLVEQGIRLLGVDGLSVQEYGDASLPSVHHLLLSAGIIIVEGLNLAEVRPGRYQLICLPLRLAGGDGAPARVVLVR